MSVWLAFLFFYGRVIVASYGNDYQATDVTVGSLDKNGGTRGGDGLCTCDSVGKCHCATDVTVGSLDKNGGTRAGDDGLCTCDSVGKCHCGPPLKEQKLNLPKNQPHQSGEPIQHQCGIRYAVNRHRPAISYGHKTVRSEYPWHVAIYREHNATTKPQYICGGSIIDHHLVLTAAHCVYDEHKYGIDNATFIVVAGKHYVSWDTRDSVEQRLKVTEIKIPETYVGFENRYADDIAVLALNQSFKFSSVVMPICIDWTSKLTIDQLSTPGMVVGWGLNEKGKLSYELSQAQLNYYNFSTCRNAIAEEGFSSFITSDKYCAGLKNGTAVQKGDSGGGFVYPRNSSDHHIQQYYLYGIVSTKNTWRSNIAAFTDSLGWGADYEGKLNGEMKVVKFLFLEWDKCKEMDKYSDIPLTEDKLCATSDYGFKDLKSGFSGGSFDVP